MSQRARWLLPLSLIIMLTLLFFYKLAFTDMILARGDTYVYFYPYWDARNAAMRAGELPLWTPDIFMGAPLLANPQLGTFYPLNWLTIPFNAPDAIRISILMHIATAGVAVYALFRKAVARVFWPAALAGIVYAFGGYLSTHVEQINQLQGLAWMPVLFLLYHALLENLRAGDRRRIGLYSLLMGAAFAMQLFTGHTQTVFTTGLGLGLYGLVAGVTGETSWTQKLRPIAVGLILLALAAIIGALLAVPQLLPTMELTGLSNRGGGFTAPQATAFSWPPQAVGRGLLPSYDGQVFGEYVAYTGVIGLGLALIGLLSRFPQAAHENRHVNPRAVWAVIGIIGIIFAFGRYNPLYWLLAELPGFNLFRVPARWLALFSLAAAMFSGIGLYRLLYSENRPSWRVVGITGGVLGGLMLLARFVLQMDPVDITGPAIPTNTTLLLWVIALVALIGVLILRPRRYSAPLILSLATIELFLSAQVIPYNDLTPPDVYTGQRFTISQMLAYTEDQTPPGRTLAISQLYFDPGDKAALDARYIRDGLDELSIRHALVAVKRQEMLYPNLPLTWGIPSVDGFGGGVLPTIYYSQFTSLMLPEGTQRTVDGRLGELMALQACRGACIPGYRWLQMTDTEYLIIDKVYDLWHEDVAYDTAFAVVATSERGASFVSPNNAPFTATRIDVLFSGTDTAPVIRQFSDAPVEMLPELDGLSFARYMLDEPTQINELSLSSRDGSVISIRAISLVDSRTGVFVQMTPAAWLRTLSSDIKIYQPNLDFPRLTTDDLPRRAWIAHDVAFEPDTWQGGENALELLKAGESAVIHRAAESRVVTGHTTPDHVTFTRYSDTQIEIQATTDTEGYLMLSDAYYPGWQATVNGEAAEVYRANVMFRAVKIPAGESRVVFSFQPTLWYGALLAGAALWLALIGLMIWTGRSLSAHR